MSKFKQEERQRYEDLWFVFIDPSDKLLEGKEIPEDVKCRLVSHKFLPAFSVLVNGIKVHDLEPLEVLYAMAEGRLVFDGPYSRDNFADVLNEKLVANEKLKAALSTACSIAISAVAVAVGTAVAVIAYKKHLLR